MTYLFDLKIIFPGDWQNIYSTMEVMEDGNLLDKVRILLQRDQQYYEQNQKVLQETICSGVAGNVHHTKLVSDKLLSFRAPAKSNPMAEYYFQEVSKAFWFIKGH